MKNSRPIARVLGVAAALLLGATVSGRATAAEAALSAPEAGSSPSAPAAAHGNTHRVKKGSATNGKKHLVGRGAHAPQAHHTKKHTKPSGTTAPAVQPA